MTCSIYAGPTFKQISLHKSASLIHNNNNRTGCKLKFATNLWLQIISGSVNNDQFLLSWHGYDTSLTDKMQGFIISLLSSAQNPKYQGNHLFRHIHYSNLPHLAMQISFTTQRAALCDTQILHPPMSST